MFIVHGEDSIDSTTPDGTRDGFIQESDDLVSNRFHETEGEMHTSIGAFGMRMSDVEKGMRLVDLSQDGFRIRGPIAALTGLHTLNTPDVGPRVPPRR